MNKKDTKTNFFESDDDISEDEEQSPVVNLKTSTLTILLRQAL
jgi:hypothetical protein